MTLISIQRESRSAHRLDRRRLQRFIMVEVDGDEGVCEGLQRDLDLVEVLAKALFDRFADGDRDQPFEARQRGNCLRTLLLCWAECRPARR
jgi:hypothetical protein